MTFFVDFLGVGFHPIGTIERVDVLRGPQRRISARLPHVLQAAGSSELGGSRHTNTTFKPSKNLVGSSGRSKGAPLRAVLLALVQES